ncbi:ATP-binding protein [Mucilaginibacter sp. KACC 22063]|uniref:ATP-binding protein n=1 Tax=Mucilaginibacter sp. KACC 22063 TaxID=3025666 RepID=UPI002366A9DE|nr:ATP-binding protein [Mucilaginibacter sp. KACC 22063]WDF53925.1 ATP-binding protein [Mucilaginibacter sp. KACC 22063]
MPKNQELLNEQKRLSALESYDILDTATEQDFDDITELATNICGFPIGLISFVDSSRQWFKSVRGLSVRQTDRAHSFCAYTVATNDVFIVEDARIDDRFKHNPLVTGDPHIVFYAGVPLTSQDGYTLGSLCLIDNKKRTLSDMQLKSLQILSRQVMDKLELRKKVVELRKANNEINELRNEQFIQENEAREVIKYTPMAMALHVGENMTIKFANELMLQAWDKTDEVFGKAFAEALPELAGLDFPTTMLGVYKSGVALRYDNERMTYLHQGVYKEFYYSYAFTPLKTPNGNIWGILNTALDVTEVVKGRLKIEQAEEQLRLALDSAKLGTWYIVPQTNELVLSERSKEMFGFKPAEQITLERAVEIIDQSHRDKVMSAITSALEEGAPYNIEYPILLSAGDQRRWVRATGKIFAATDGAGQLFSGTLLDITRQKEEEQRKNDFIGIVSHELRTPITSISGYAQVLQLKAKKLSDPSIYEIASKSKLQADRMAKLISGFLDIARIGEGKIKIEYQTFDMAELVKEAEEESIATITTHRVIFKPVEHTLVNADCDKTRQVIINLINNAVKYSPSGSEIHVACVTHQKLVQVSVTDNGMGISENDQQHVFERFYRVESEQMKTVKGFGIGLYLCKEIIERHGGKIGVESVLGKGSTFWFTLPAL